MPFERSALPLPQRLNNAYCLPLPNEIAYRLPLTNCLQQGNAYRLPQEFEQSIEQFMKQLLKQLGVGVDTFPPLWGPGRAWDRAQAGPGTRPRTLGLGQGEMFPPLPPAV